MVKADKAKGQKHTLAFYKHVFQLVVFGFTFLPRLMKLGVIFLDLGQLSFHLEPERNFFLQSLKKRDTT